MPTSLAASPTASTAPQNDDFTPTDPTVAPAAPKPPERRRMDAARVKGLFGGEEDFYNALGNAGDQVRDEINAQPNPLAERVRMANTAFLADRFDLSAADVAQRYDSLRESYAQQMFPDLGPFAGETQFHSAVGRQLQQEAQEAELMGELNRQLFTAALGGKDFKTAWQDVQASGPGLVAKNRADVFNAWAMQRWEANTASVAKLGPLIGQAADYFADIRSEAAKDGDDYARRRTALVEGMTALSQEERASVWSLALERAQATPQAEKGAVRSTVEAFGQGFGDLFDNALFGLMNASDLTQAIAPSLVGPSQRSIVERELNQAVSDGAVPIKGDSFGGQVALDFVRSVPTMLAAMTGPGLVIDYLALKQQARDNLESQGARGIAVEATAAVQAIPQTALFFASSKMAFLGKTPGFSMPAQWTVKNFAGNVGKVAAYEYAGNFALNELGFLSDAGIQAVASQMTAHVPDVDWNEFGQQFVDRLPQSLAMAIPGALIGTGTATFRNVKAGREYLRNVAVMDDLGFTPEAKEAVLAAPDYATAEQAYKAGWEERSTTPKPEIPPDATPAPDAPQVEALGRRFLVMEGVGEPVAQFQVKRAGDDRGVTMTADQLTAEGIAVPPDTLTEIATVRAMGGEAFRSWAKQQKGGFTTTAHNLGQAVSSRGEVNALLRAQVEAEAQLEESVGKARKGDMDAMSESMLLSTKAQFFREAYEAALGVLSAGDHLRKKDPNFVPPIVRNADGTYSVQATKDAPPATAATSEGAAMVAQEQRLHEAQNAATAQPEPRPEADDRPLPPRTSALNKEAIAALRQLFGLEALDAPQRERFIQVLDEAKRTNGSASAEAIAADILAKQRVASASEHAALVLRSVELQNQYESLLGQIADAHAAGLPEQAQRLRTVADNVQAQLDTLTEASDLSGTEIARALSIRRMRINRDDYTLAKTVQRMRTAKQAEATPEDRAALKALTDDLIAQQQIIAEQRNQLREQDVAVARKNVETFVAEGRVRRRQAASVNAGLRRKALKDELIKMGVRVNDITSLVPMSGEYARIVAKIADTYIEEGVATLAELTNKLKADLPDLSDQDIFTAVGRQTKKEAAKITDEAKRRVKELRSQAALWAKINTLLEGKRPDGMPAGSKEQQNKLLRQSLAELRRQANRTIFDDAALKRIDAKIAEVQNHLAKGTRPAPVPKPEGNEKLNAAKEALKALRQEMGAIDTIAELERLVGESEPKPAAEGQLAAKPDPTEQAARLNSLRERIAELRDQIDAEQVDPAAVNADRLAKLQRLAAELESHIEEGTRPERTQRGGTPDSDDVASARRQVRELERLMRTNESIADLENQLRTGNYKVSAPEQRILTNAKLEAALIRQKQLRRSIDELIERNRKRSAVEKVVEGLLVPRTLLAMGDMSATLRQGLLLSASRPVTAVRAFVSSFRAFLNENTADAIAVALENRPHFVDGQKAGLFLSEIDGRMSAREENFLSNWTERIPGLGWLKRGSERSMATTLNLLRASAFDSFLDSHPEATDAQRKAYAQYVNAASGRGNVKWSPSTVKTLNAVFFAPRYAVSRFQALYSPFKNFNDPVVRNAIVKDFAALLGTGLTVLSLAAMAGADVTLDPSESDFGKIVVGDTRIDIFGGLQQPARLVAQAMLLVPQKAGLVELENDIDVLDAAGRFLSYKLSPAITVPLALASGENIIGQEQEIPETLLRSMVPLTLQEAWDVGRENESAAAGVGAGVAGALGLGVQQHEK